MVIGLRADCLGIFKKKIESIIMTTPVPSPCISICQMSLKTGLCEGCHRTIEEIAEWSALSDDEKMSVLEQTRQRILEQA
jgi:uncharacterized protein